MGLPPKRPDPNFVIVPKTRAGTILGDRGETYTPRSAPRHVGLTEPPAQTPGHPLRRPTPPVGNPVPRNEFDFEQATPSAMDPATYHALVTIQSQSQAAAQAILDMVQAQDDAREVREAKKRDEEGKLAAARAERRGKFVIAGITALCAGIAVIIAALSHGCS